MLLVAFLNSQESALERGEWPDFEALLAVEDDKLWDYLQFPERAPEPFTGMIQGIRRHHVSAN